MIAGRSVLAVIPARGGSKGIPRKNITPLAGRPLIAWTIDAARQSRHVDRAIVSSDDEAIIAVARDCGCEAPFVRPRELALDTTPGIEPVLHALAEVPGYDIVVLLQPTSPLRDAADIDGCVEQLARSDAPAVVSVREAVDHPYWTYRVSPRGGLEPFVTHDPAVASRRQDLPQAFIVNGAVYAARVDALKASRSFLVPGTLPWMMPAERSIDIDSAQDLVAAEAALKRRRASCA
jgi:N-acylneuraminate cytidylyltransferase